jgi:hypothetical protein
LQRALDPAEEKSCFFELEMRCLGRRKFMSDSLHRRDFLKTASAVPLALARAARSEMSGAPLQNPKPSELSARIKLQAFNYQGVRLLESRWQQQYRSARDYYFGVLDDDIMISRSGL